VSVFRRRIDAPDVLDNDEAPEKPDSPARQASKGHATPKRSEVERRRREPYAPPSGNRKQDSAQKRERQRTESKRRMDAMRRGEEWAIPAKDRGPVRALARDYIDSRRFILSEYILFGILVLIFALFFLDKSKHSDMILYIELVIVGIIAIEALFHAAMVTRLAKQRLPGESTRGLTWYIIKRNIKIRSSRIPPPRVDRGQNI
jgi:Protein of unknown function (DUF3043)